MDKTKYFCISVDGMPYSGKTTVCSYLKKLDKKHMIVDDGVIKSATMARCISKSEPDYSQLKCTIVVYLLAAKEDWSLRCANPEVANRHDEIAAEMNKTAQKLDDEGVTVLVYNTSKYTPYMIAKDILKQIDSLESKPQEQQLSADSQQTSQAAEA